ncbi:MAG: 1-deoxy-D-xylulose-5-phosphate synthase N-terminal domain-containing protein, partial [Caldicoprobacterales bacterium]
MTKYKLLDSIDGPMDLKALTLDEMKQLCKEMRAFILDSVSNTGGHLASNLGVVELTLA